MDLLPGFHVAGEPLPFEDLFVAFVLEARNQLRRGVDVAAYELLTPEAHAGWERYLLTRLTTAAAKSADWQFQIFKTVRQVFPLGASATSREANSLYRDFIGERPEDRLEKLFGEFPALAQLCTTLVQNWLSAVSEFLERLAADRNHLSVPSKAGRCVGPVVALQAGLSDPHRGGRCVARMCFENGARLIYKPRSLAPEAHFATLLDQINVAGIPHRLRSAHCWDQGKYGWMEDIEHRPCSTRTDIHAFYWRAGVLLGLVYLARGVDFHQENLIAAGESPVLIDVEALWHPQEPRENHSSIAVDSVLRTGFLPQGNPRFGALYEWSALSRQILPPRATATWVCINQDSMSLQTARRGIQNQTHLPVFAGAACLASEHVTEIQSGFQWLGERLLGSDEGREEFGRWLRALVNRPRRLIVGLTTRYQAARERLTLPLSLRGERIGGNPTRAATQRAGARWEEEFRALEQGDIPYFEQDDHGNDPLNDPAPWCPPQEKYLAQVRVIADALAGSLQADKDIPGRAPAYHSMGDVQIIS